MNHKGLAIMILAAVILLLLIAPMRKSNFGTNSSSMPIGYNTFNQPVSGAIHNLDVGQSNDYSGGMQGGDSVSSASLIPREVIGTEDFGQFSPDNILGNQNYLDPRSQIGYPETVGGVLRNANRDFRSEPANPRTPVSIFNLSTIPPDVMRPRFEIDRDYQ